MDGTVATPAKCQNQIQEQGTHEMRVAMAVQLFGILVCLGCSSSVPSTKEVTKNLAQLADEYSDVNRVKIRNFKKTDGLASVVNGVAHYDIEYECEIEFTADCVWLSKKDL